MQHLDSPIPPHNPPDIKQRSTPHLPANWTWGRTVLLMVAAIILVPVVWLLLSKWLGTPAVATGDTGGLLATIGGVMGAIFTVGGLVIALVAILTQLSVEARVQNAVADARSELEQRFHIARQDMEQRYEHELRPELIQRAKQQVQAQIAFFQATATEISDWRTAEQLTRQALENDPNLENARSFLALRLSQLVIARFWAQHMPRTDFDITRWATKLNSLPIAHSVGFFELISHRPSRLPDPLAVSSELPVLEAITWLRESLEHSEDVGGRVAADLALMYAVEGRHDKMIEAIKQARALNPEQTSYLVQPYQLCILTYACGASEQRLQQLGAALDMPLPTPHDDIVASVEQYTPNPASNPAVAWYVIPRPLGHEQPTAVAFPAKLNLFVYINNDARTITARYFERDGLARNGPEDIPPADESGLVQPQSIGDLVTQLMERFSFICQTSPQ